MLSRTQLWDRLLADTAEGQLLLPVCLACGGVQYPPQSHCARCLGDAMETRAVATGATVLAHTRLHVSWEPAFAARLPIPVVLVRLDAGPVAYAFAEGLEPQVGERVNIGRGDCALGPVLMASPAA